MAGKPILFSAPMISALMTGNKTQTRRVIKQQPEITDNGSVHVYGRHGGCVMTGRHGTPEMIASTLLEYASLHAVGDRLWVREAFTKTPAGISYAADGITHFGGGGRLKVTPSLFMPRWVSRLTLIVEGVKIERLQDISRGDAMLEGCPFPNMAAGPNPRDWFRDLWNRTNGPGAWNTNPWVVAYGFRVIRANIDQVQP